jgi:putative phosphoribosyl transferase
MFQDRREAGTRLAEALGDYRGRNALVLAIPRGGVPVGWEVARALGADFSVVIVRKLPFPDNPEAGFGAVAEDGSTVLVRDGLREPAPEVTRRVLEEQKREVQRRVRALRGGVPLPGLQGRLVILVDDGLAMGSTMQAAVILCRNRRAQSVVVAVPVSGSHAFRAVGRLADRVVALEQPPNFRAVAEVYRHWRDLTDREVLEILRARGGESAGRGVG